MTDTQLITDYRNGNAQAFNKLVEKWQHRVHGLAYRYFYSYDDAWEITQKTFIKAYRKLDTLDESEKFSSWIYRIANNLCLDELKRSDRKKTYPLDEINAVHLANNLTSNPGANLQNNQIEKLLHRALSRLPFEQRVVVILKEFEGLTFREIAAILEESENTVKSRMYYGLKKLKHTFDQWNIDKEVLNYES